ncbi:XdhC family protein [Microbacterium sp. ASV81]|uniref:XdhC family protein n=1 Tax=Microbacterium capsulatum TaxID=3041921 RepID=A0ABU0XJK4_9MICO|nr:XdhC family protein [Microbacterium sp. ASV81]MDQ4215292.1 XdhC family protein [Microbacterium sp. ASV81]
MLDRIQDYRECFAEPGRWAIATIAEVSGSVPRPAGTSMAVRDDGRTIGSVSGGCVEGAVVGAALTCLETGEAALHSFGYADDDGLSVGLMCGGDVRVLVQPLAQITAADELLRADAGLAMVRELPLADAGRNGGIVAGAAPLPADALCAVIDAAAGIPAALALEIGSARDRVAAAVRAGGAHIVEITDRSAPECAVVRRLLVESTTTPARLIIYGANDFSAALAHAAAVLGRHVTVCDARPVFATRDRHPGAHEVVLRHPAEHFADELAAGRIDGRTAIVLLTHDPRFDLPVLESALRLDLAYVGAMGSRSTHEKRAQELRAGGLPADRLALLHSPIGLDLGARTPAEVAVSILAELILAESTTRAALAPRPLEAFEEARTVPPRLCDTAGDVHDPRRICAPDHPLDPDPALTDLFPDPDRGLLTAATTGAGSWM